jgi:hypothetical protein
LLVINLHSSTRDEEPLVNGAINRSRGKVLAARNAGKLRGVDAVRVAEGGVGPAHVSIVLWILSKSNLQADVSTVRLSADELLPGISTLVDDLLGVPAPVRRRDIAGLSRQTYFLFLASPEKANWFSGFPSGIL